MHQELDQISMILNTAIYGIQNNEPVQAFEEVLKAVSLVDKLKDASYTVYDRDALIGMFGCNRDWLDDDMMREFRQWYHQQEDVDDVFVDKIHEWYNDVLEREIDN